METEKVEIVLDEREFSALMQLVFKGFRKRRISRAVGESDNVVKLSDPAERRRIFEKALGGRNRIHKADQGKGNKIRANNGSED